MCKPPGLGAEGSASTRHPLHQDLLYFPVGSRDAEGSLAGRDFDGIVCAWAAVGDVDRSNGCLCFLPGSHRGGMRNHGYPRGWASKYNAGYLGIADLTGSEKERRVHAEMKASVPTEQMRRKQPIVRGASARRIALSARAARGVATDCAPALSRCRPATWCFSIPRRSMDRASTSVRRTTLIRMRSAKLSACTTAALTLPTSTGAISQLGRR